MIKTRIIYFSALISAVFLMCNPVSEDVPDVICSGLHPENIGDHCHGAKYKDPINSCDDIKCHGTGLQGGNTGGVSCYTCHGNRWDTLKSHTVNVIGIHHHFNIIKGDPAFYCIGPACHGADLTIEGLPYGGPPCTKCHLSVPTGTGIFYVTHTANKEGRRHHYNISRENPPVYCTGTACHGSDLAVGNLPDGGPACTKSGCHGSVPTGGDDR